MVGDATHCQQPEAPPRRGACHGRIAGRSLTGRAATVRTGREPHLDTRSAAVRFGLLVGCRFITPPAASRRVRGTGAEPLEFLGVPPCKPLPIHLLLFSQCLRSLGSKALMLACVALVSRALSRSHRSRPGLGLPGSSRANPGVLGATPEAPYNLIQGNKVPHPVTARLSGVFALLKTVYNNGIRKGKRHSFETS